jgi:hypothetical protein
MRLFGVMMVRNEADIIEASVRHNLSVLDGLVVIDHGSFDATADILVALLGGNARGHFAVADALHGDDGKAPARMIES